MGEEPGSQRHRGHQGRRQLDRFERVVFGGLAVGLIETYSGVLIGSTFKNLVPFILLMVLLVFRPQGLFGAAEIKRV